MHCWNDHTDCSLNDDCYARMKEENVVLFFITNIGMCIFYIFYIFCSRNESYVRFFKWNVSFLIFIYVILKHTYMETCAVQWASRIHNIRNYLKAKVMQAYVIIYLRQILHTYKANVALIFALQLCKYLQLISSIIYRS